MIFLFLMASLGRDACKEARVMPHCTSKWSLRWFHTDRQILNNLYSFIQLRRLRHGSLAVCLTLLYHRGRRDFNSGPSLWEPQRSTDCANRTGLWSNPEGVVVIIYSRKFSTPFVCPRRKGFQTTKAVGLHLEFYRCPWPGAGSRRKEILNFLRPIFLPIF